ncbi:MAG: hypothetical protein ILNGONEN_01270 [Syntrophorhabdaceae bacterium]|nr:hypothetical protein [Syntrophorhabdaceae bacterium]
MRYANCLWVHIFLIVIFLQGIIQIAFCEDVSIMFDISQSMRSEWSPASREAVVQALTTLVRYGYMPENWIPLNPDDSKFYPFLRKGTALMRSSDKLLTMSFGEATEISPYFKDVSVKVIASADDAASFIASKTPAAVPDPWTFLQLAEAVGWSQIRRNRTSNQNAPIIVIVVSDLKEDKNHELTNEQSELIVEFDKERKCTPLTFEYAGDRGLKIRLNQVGVVCTGTNQIMLLSPQEGVTLKSDKPLALVSKWLGQKDNRIQYTFMVRKKIGRHWKGEPVRQQPQPQFLKKFESGQYQWYVLCNTPWGIFRSQIRNFKVESSVPVAVILIGMVGLVGLAVLLRYAFPAIERLRGFRRKETKF